MPACVNIDGSIFDAEEARISVFDHGFLYGDSVYETLRTFTARPFLLSRHYERLQHSAEALGLTLPWTSGRLRDEVGRTLEAARNTESLIRVIATRGVGDLNPDPCTCPAPTMLILVQPLQEPPEELYSRGITITVSKFVRDPQIASIKTGSLIHQVLGIAEANVRGAAEAILLTRDGYVSDGTRSNVYLVHGDRVLTPSDDTGIVQGITRGVVLEVAREIGIRIVEGQFDPSLFGESSEVFLTSTTRGVFPVTRVDDGLVGNGEVGPVTRRLDKAYRETVGLLIAED